MVLNGIVWKFRTGTAWREFPSGTGPGPRCIPASAGGRGTAPSSGCCVPRRPGRTRPEIWSGWCRSTPPCARPPARRRGPKGGLRVSGLGRSRGDLTSKVHLACDAVGRPLAFTVTGGNTNHCTQFTAVMNAIRVPRSGPGRPRTRPAHVLGDKGYSSKAIRTWLRWRSIGHTIPERADQVRNRLRRGSRGGRPPAFDRQLYKQRNVVERCFNRLKQWRGSPPVTTRPPSPTRQPSPSHRS
jgi:transposase